MSNHDKGIAQRFKTFRKQHIANNMDEASVFLGISKSRISRIENAHDPIPVAIIQKLIRQKSLNREWLFDSKGNMTIKEKPKNTVTDIAELKDIVQGLTLQVAILNKNQQKLWEIVEAQTMQIKALESKT